MSCCWNPRGHTAHEPVFIEPTGINLLRRAGDLALYEQIITFRDAYFRAFESGDKEAARQVIDLHDGDGSFDALPPRARDYIMATTATNILDWRSHLGWDAPLPAHSGIAVPVLIIRGGRGHPYIARSAEILSGAMPNASPVTVPGAAHSVITTHAAEVARLIAGNVSKAEALTYTWPRGCRSLTASPAGIWSMSGFGNPNRTFDLVSAAI